MSEKQPIVLGSLFDGIGGFPYAASFYGIEALWSSEILPAAVSVTKRHFPGMAHVGDITALDGAKLPPVDIITFGSPCQDLSVAGKRAGLDGARSGLFMEAIRIIREMREATNGKQPRFALWENVPGALSSSGGFDFKAVLEAFAETEVPVPQSRRWANAGMVRSRGADIAWCVYCASHFGVPQRRRRIFLIVDFRGERAGEILFVPKSLRGYFAAGGTPRQGPAAYAPRGADGPGAGRCAGSNCLTPWDTQQSRVYTAQGVSPTLAGADGGGGRNPAGLLFTPEANRAAAFLGGSGAKARSIGYSEKVAPTLKAGACGFMAPCLCAATGQPNAEIMEDQSPTLTCYHEQPILCEPKMARTLTASDGSPCADRGQNIVAVGVHQNQSGDVSTSETAYTLSTCSNASARNAPLVAHPKVAGTLCASGAGLSRPAGMASETDLCVAYPNSEPTAAVDCRNLRETEELSGTLQAKENGSYSLNYQNPIRTGYIVRRLTPTECERLQGYPDGWTERGADGKLISDTARYMMLGNSVAVPCVAYIMQGITAAIREEVI